MSINFPNTLDTLTNPSASSDTVTVSHAGQHSDTNDAIEALEAKVGVNGSSVTTSLDYLVKNTSSIDPGHKHTVANLSDTTISSPTNGQALTYDSATSKWVNTAVSAADASTTVKGSTKLSVAPVSSSNPIAVGDNDTRVPSQAENDALAGTSGTPSNTNRYVTNDDTGTSGANKVLRLDGSGALPAVSGANLTSLPSMVAATGSGTFSSAGTITCTHNLGRVPKLIRITALTVSALNLLSSHGTYANSTYAATGFIRTSGSQGVFVSSSAIIFLDGFSGGTWTGTLASIGSTSFDLVITGSLPQATYTWEAIA